MAEILENTDFSAPDVDRVAREVLETFRSARPHDAFDTAVRAYRRHNPNVPNTLARRAVAKIICGRVMKQPQSRSRSIATSGSSAGGIG